ncbi:MAG: hypothetical protein ABJA18_08020 [bacterium]
MEYSSLPLKGKRVLFISYNGMLVPLVLWLLMLGARATVAIWRNRACYPAGLFENAVRMLVLIPIIATLDAATIIGTLQWALKDKPGL